MYPSGSKFESDPIFVGVTSSGRDHAAGFLDSGRVEVVLQHNGPVEVDHFSVEDPREAVTFECLAGDTKSYSFTCPNKEVLSLDCPGTAVAKLMRRQCPLRLKSTVCNSVEGAGGVDGSQCDVVSYTANQTVCSCPLSPATGSAASTTAAALLKSGRLLGSGNATDETVSVSFVAMALLVGESLTDAYSVDHVVFDGGVIGVFVSTVVCVAAAMLLGHYLDLRDRYLTDTEKHMLVAAMGLNARVVRRSSAELKKADAFAMLRSSLPEIYQQSESFGQRLYAELQRHHRYLGPMIQFVESYPRPLRVLALAIDITAMLFVQSITYSIRNQDDGECRGLSSRNSCLEPRLTYFSGESKCYWLPSVASYVSPINCRLRTPNDSLLAVVYVAALASYLVFAMVLAPPSSRVVEAEVMESESMRESLSGRHGVAADGSGGGGAGWPSSEKVFRWSAEEDLAALTALTALTAGIVSYRVELSSVDQTAFDGTIVCVFKFHDYCSM